ncbi:MAG: carboxypeptidase-like regulatory domain-containing protein [Dysgonamonadaceae bacterium]|jgi:hypothetical protein|nr:carboxypeptidase-like regulatory domain-containing protein [Dysgonamonadaceae bacterium]
MKDTFIIGLLLSFSTLSYSQIVIQGTVTDKDRANGINGVNVMIQELGSTTILAYSLTDNAGKFKLEYKGAKDSLIISASGFNIRKQTRTIVSKSQTVNFDALFESIALKEVKVTLPKIKQRGDTIDYLVDGFIDKNDRSIGDVIKKLPGFEVKESGQILYQDKPINKMYVEDMDLLQGRYGIATNNIEAKNVQSVQVLENHQPIKALKDRVLSEQAAINLKLKDSAKGAVTANALLGAGASPLLWNGEVVAMYFAKKRQNITTFKGNNSGNDVSRDLNSFYSVGASQLSGNGMLGVQSPSSPAINKRRYLFNRANAFTFNNLWKLKNDYQMNANIFYLNDRLDKSSLNHTEYFLPGSAPVRIDESLSSRLFTNRADAEMQLSGNKEKFYLNDLLKFSGGWDRERGSADGIDTVGQRLYSPEYSVNNTFKWVKNYEKTSLNVSSFNGYSFSPHSLTITPLLYENLFEPSSNAESMRQSVRQNNFRSISTVSAGYKKGGLSQDYALSFRADLQHLDSELQDLVAQIGRQQTAPDSLRNNLQWDKLEWVFSPRYTYLYNDWRFSLSLPLNYTLLSVDDRIRDRQKNDTRLYFNPSLSLMYKISAYWDMTANASYSNGMGGINNEYAGYIMRSYRNLIRNEGSLYETKSQTLGMRFTYRNPIRSLFGNAQLSYSNRRANLLYGYDFDGILQVQNALRHPNRSESVSASMNVNQTIDAIASTVKLGGSYSVSSASQLAGGEIIPFETNAYSLTPGIATKIQSWSSFSYSLTFRENKTQIKSATSDRAPIRTISQNADLNFFLFNGLTINLGYEYFYNNAITVGSRNMSFGDFGAKYKWKDVELLLDYTNIFNSKQYISASYSDISSYYYAYDLRPAEILLRVRFKLK